MTLAASQISLNSFLLLVSKSCFSVNIEDNNLADFLLLDLRFSNLEFSTDASTSIVIFDWGLFSLVRSTKIKIIIHFFLMSFKEHICKPEKILYIWISERNSLYIQLSKFLKQGDWKERTPTTENPPSTPCRKQNIVRYCSLRHFFLLLIRFISRSWAINSIFLSNWTCVVSGQCSIFLDETSIIQKIN